nr:PREDICTED: sugar transporter ERD6-like 3 isoform X3 [Daucus carota subsp. sativus]
MERESMEEGLINKFMSKDDIKINDVASSSVTPLLLFSAGLSGLAAFSNGCAFGYTSAAEAGIMEDLNLSIAQFSLFGSLLNFGGMFGAISSGKIADLMGRKLTMLLMDVSLIIGWSAIIFAQVFIGIWIWDSDLLDSYQYMLLKSHQKIFGEDFLEQLRTTKHYFIMR